MINNITSAFPDNSKYFLNTPRCVNRNSSSFTHTYIEHDNLPLTQKAVVVATSAAGMALPLAFWSKKAGFSLNPKKIIRTPVKDWALFKYKPINKAVKFEGPQIMTVAAGSVAGGFAGGVIVDKENIRAKKREVLSQLLGDVIVPIMCVWGGAKAFNKYSDKLQSAMPKIKNNFKIFSHTVKKDSKFTKAMNAISENIPNILATIGSLAIGIISGNKVSNEINEKLYHKKVERGIKATDFAPHVDDVCMALTMMNEKSTFGSKLGRIIPLALLVPGYETGTAREG